MFRYAIELESGRLTVVYIEASAVIDGLGHLLFYKDGYLEYGFAPGSWITFSRSEVS